MSSVDLEELEELKAGHNLDQRVAKAMGWFAENPKEIPQFSESISDAWKLVEHFTPEWCLSLTQYYDCWEAQFEPAKYTRDDQGNRQWNPLYGRNLAWPPLVSGRTAPHVICLAVLVLVKHIRTINSEEAQ